MIALPSYPDDISRVLGLLADRGIHYFLVGGSVRDFLLTGRLGDDLDFELHGKLEAWEQVPWGEVSSKVHVHPYGVRQVRVGDKLLDFAPARLEQYVAGERGHRNFTATFIPHYNFVESFKRRDFTVNAIGYTHRGGGEWIDPFSGREHLKNRNLHPCSQDFPRDPVRYLRGIRFMAMGLNPSCKLMAFLEKMPLGGLSLHYFLMELLKTGDQLFFLRQARQLNSSLPQEFQELCRVLESSPVPRWKSLEHLLYDYILGGGRLLDWAKKGERNYFKLLSQLSHREWRELSTWDYEMFKQSPRVGQYMRLFQYCRQNFRQFSFLREDHQNLLDHFNDLLRLPSLDLGQIAEKERSCYQLYHLNKK